MLLNYFLTLKWNIFTDFFSRFGLKVRAKYKCNKMEAFISSTHHLDSDLNYFGFPKSLKGYLFLILYILYQESNAH